MDGLNNDPEIAFDCVRRGGLGASRERMFR
jgi:hypothetical protein